MDMLATGDEEVMDRFAISERMLHKGNFSSEYFLQQRQEHIGGLHPV